MNEENSVEKRVMTLETKVLNQSVRRNLERFEGDYFMFELTREECNGLIIISRSQFVTLNKRGSNIKYAPMAFTELGVAMLSSVLRSKTAIEINRNIMLAFVAVRNVLYSGEINKSRIDKLELINIILAELQANTRQIPKERAKIGFKK